MLDPDHNWNVDIKPLAYGFIISFILVVMSYMIATENALSFYPLMWILLGLATAQAVLQMALFLHIGLEPVPRWNLVIALFMALVIVVLVGGSIWIMSNLDYNVMV